MGKGVRPLLVTFSGLDGAGKSALAADLAGALRGRGARASVLRMYDISAYAYIRAARDRVRRALGRPVPVSAGQVGSGAMYTMARHATTRRAAFLADLASVLWQRIQHQLIRGEILILDRYLYDLLVDMSGPGWPSLRLLLAFTPRPDLPVYLDVAPELAFDRKGEFDIPYLSRRRDGYRWIFARVREPLIVPSDDLASARSTVERAVLAMLG